MSLQRVRSQPARDGEGMGVIWGNTASALICNHGVLVREFITVWTGMELCLKSSFLAFGKKEIKW